MSEMRLQKYLSEQGILSRRAAEEEIRAVDKRRKRYYDTYTGRSWGLPENYDFCINSSVRGIEGTADQIVAWAELERY